MLSRASWKAALNGLVLMVTISGVVFALAQSEQQDECQRVTEDGLFKQRPAWSPDGRWLVFARHTEDSIVLILRDTSTGAERRLTHSEHPEYDAVFAPHADELALAYDKASPNQGDIDVCLVPLAGEPLTPLATSQGKLSHEESPSWSPDGQWLAYTSTYEGNQEVYVMHRDASQRRRLTTHPGLDSHPAWCPDGQRIALATDRWGDLEIAVMDIDGANVLRLTESPGLDDYPAWSADGQWLAYASNRDGNLEIYVCDRQGGHLRNVSRHAEFDSFPAWTPANELSYVSSRDGGFDIYRLRLEL